MSGSRQQWLSMSVWGRLTTTVSGSVGYVGIPITFSVWGYLTASEYVGVEASYSLDYEGGGAWTSASFSFTTVLTLTVYSYVFGKTLTVGADAFVGASTPTSTTLLILVEASTSSTTTAATTTTTTATTTTSSTSPTTSSPSSTSSSATFWARIEEVRAIETTTVPPEAVSAVIPITVYVTGYAPNAVDIAVYAHGANDWEEDDLGVYGPNEAISAAATLYYTIHTFNSPDAVTIELDTDTYFSYTAVVITLEAVKQTPTTTTTVTSTTTTTTTTTATSTTSSTMPVTTIRAGIVGAQIQNPYQPAGYGDYYITVVVTLTNEGDAANFYLDVEVPGGPENGINVYMLPEDYTVVTVVLDHDFYIYGAGVFGVDAYLEYGGTALDQAYAGAYTIESTSIISTTTITGKLTAIADVSGEPVWGEVWGGVFTGWWAIAEWDGQIYAPMYTATVMLSAAGGVYGYYWVTTTVTGIWLGNTLLWEYVTYGAYTYATYYLPGNIPLYFGGWVDEWYDYDTNFDLTSYDYTVYGIVNDLGQTSIYIEALLSVIVSASGAEAYMGGYAVYASSSALW